MQQCHGNWAADVMWIQGEEQGRATWPQPPANHFLIMELWRNTHSQFVKAAKITNVNIVANHILKQGIWRDIFTQFMKATKTTHVNIVASHFGRGYIEETYPHSSWRPQRSQLRILWQIIFSRRIFEEKNPQNSWWLKKKHLSKVFCGCWAFNK